MEIPQYQLCPELWKLLFFSLMVYALFLYMRVCHYFDGPSVYSVKFSIAIFSMLGESDDS